MIRRSVCLRAEGWGRVRAPLCWCHRQWLNIPGYYELIVKPLVAWTWSQSWWEYLHSRHQKSAINQDLIPELCAVSSSVSHCLMSFPARIQFQFLHLKSGYTGVHFTIIREIPHLYILYVCYISPWKIF